MAEGPLQPTNRNHRLDANEADEAAVLVESLQDYPNWYSPFAIAKLDVIRRFFSLSPSDSLCRCLMDGTKVRVGVNGSDKSPQVRIFTSHFLALPSRRHFLLLRHLHLQMPVYFCSLPSPQYQTIRHEVGGRHRESRGTHGALVSTMCDGLVGQEE